MTLPKHILVATDFTHTSDAALDYALEFSKVVGARVTLVHAYELAAMAVPDALIAAGGELMTELRKASDESLNACLEKIRGRGDVIDGIVRAGRPWKAIVDASREVGADMIVVGTHGRRGMSRVLLGSVAENVVRVADVPVITLHRDEALPA